MTNIILNDETARVPIGELLGSARDSEIQITDQSGNPVARILLTANTPEGETRRAVADAEAALEELRRRRQRCRADDVGTEELLARAHQATAE